MRRLLVVQMFNGTRLRFGKAALANDAATRVQHGRALGKTAHSADKGGPMASGAVATGPHKDACEQFIVP